MTQADLKTKFMNAQPVSADEAMDAYWLAEILGNPDDRKAALQKRRPWESPVPIQP